MTAFGTAWNFLKADPRYQGKFGTLHPSIQGMMDRALASGRLGEPGDVRHERMQVMNPMQQAIEGGQSSRGDYPVEVGEGMGEPLPMQPEFIERDLSPLREDVTSQIGRSTRLVGGKLDDRYGYRDIPAYQTMPEESYFTPREQYNINPDFARVAGRNIVGAFGGKDGTTLQQTDRKLNIKEGIAQGARPSRRSLVSDPSQQRDTNTLNIIRALQQAMQENPDMTPGQQEALIQSMQEQQADEDTLTPALQDMASELGASFSMDDSMQPQESGQTRQLNPRLQLRAEQLKPLGRQSQARLEGTKGVSGEEFRAGTQDPEVDPRLYEMMQMRSGDDLQQRLAELGRDPMSVNQAIAQSNLERVRAEARNQLRRRASSLGGSQEQSQIDREGSAPKEEDLETKLNLSNFPPAMRQQVIDNYLARQND